MHILYIEDDQVDRMAFKRMIKKVDSLSCLCVASVQAGLEELAQNDYELIITDHNLPDGSAFDVLKESKLPVIVTSGISEDPRETSFESAGAISFMVKPISAYDLKKILARLQPQAVAPAELFDLTYLKELSDEDQEFETEMISIYLDEVPPSLSKLKREIDQNQWQAASETVHKLKSKIRIMGLRHALQLSSLVEEAFRYEKIDDETLQKAGQLIQSLETSLAPASQLKNQLLNP
jgi:DNA-binding NtrC family response regulator